MTLYLASTNAHKARELGDILSAHTLLLPRDAGLADFDVEENGASFAENALLKAHALRRRLRKAGLGEAYVLADDSGLCVDILGGRPGIHSARYGMESGGERLDAAARNRRLLSEIERTLGAGSRDGAPITARFVCALAALFEGERFALVQETLEGEILRLDGRLTSRGEGGFGYDPLFYLRPLNRTVAELDPAEKNRLSHRARAARTLSRLLAP